MISVLPLLLIVRNRVAICRHFRFLPREMSHVADFEMAAGASWMDIED